MRSILHIFRGFRFTILRSFIGYAMSLMFSFAIVIAFSSPFSIDYFFFHLTRSLIVRSGFSWGAAWVVSLGVTADPSAALLSGGWAAPGA